MANRHHRPQTAMLKRGAITAVAGLALAAAPAGAAAAFEECVADLREELIQEGQPADVVETALTDVRRLDRLIELDRHQPEFVQHFWDYIDQRVTDRRVAQGRRLMEKHSELLWRIRGDYGVSPRYLVALWGMETHYGSYFGRVPVVDALVTLSCDGRRGAFFRTQLEATIEILSANRMKRADMRGSWAGAMGHTQFMPTTFLDYAIDYDGSGSTDLWGSLADAFGSSANYLRSMGWNPEQRWGREVSLTDEFDYSLAGLDHRRSVREWARAGVRRADGGHLPRSDQEGSVLLPMGRDGPAFLVYDNFRVLLRWNASISYALAVGHLADRLDGHPPLRGGRPEADSILNRQETKWVQKQLNRLGYDAGEPDGLIGPNTRRAARAYQTDYSLPADGYPDRELMRQMKRQLVAHDEHDSGES